MCIDLQIMHFRIHFRNAFQKFISEIHFEMHLRNAYQNAFQK